MVRVSGPAGWTCRSEYATAVAANRMNRLVGRAALSRPLVGGPLVRGAANAVAEDDQRVAPCGDDAGGARGGGRCGGARRAEEQEEQEREALHRVVLWVEEKGAPLVASEVALRCCILTRYRVVPIHRCTEPKPMLTMEPGAPFAVHGEVR